MNPLVAENTTAGETHGEGVTVELVMFPLAKTAAIARSCIAFTPDFRFEAPARLIENRAVMHDYRQAGFMFTGTR